MAVAETGIDALLGRYDVFLLDAFGVLVSTQGALPGAAEFLRRLDGVGKQVLVLSNDASRLPATSARRFRAAGIALPADRILTSGHLLVDYYAREGLVGARTIVLGTKDSRAYVEAAGGVPAPPDDRDARVVVVADDDGYPFLETVNAMISVLFHRLDRQQPTALVLPNPDLVFPTAPGAFGITAGAIAAMIEAIVRLRDPARAHPFVPLGKPHRPIFEAAARRFPEVDPRRMVMLGDQLATDILGAHRFGIDSVLVETGVGRRRDLDTSDVKPTWVLASLRRPASG